MATKGHFQTGTVEGTGETVHVPLGFRPSRVEIMLAGDAPAVWVSGMPDGTSGVRPFLGEKASTPDGFTIDADNSGLGINTLGNTIYFTAEGEE